MKIEAKKPTKEELDKLNVISWGIWECEPSTFDWNYTEKETCYILEGKAKVISTDQQVEFGKGDMVIFPEGLSCEWTVIEKIKKYYKFG